MAWAFRTNVPTPRLDRRLLFPLAVSSPHYTLRELATMFSGFQWSTAQMFTELMAYDARRLGLRFVAFTRPDRFLAELRTRVRPLAAPASATSIRKASP
jgi:hypothetical protein